MGRVVVVLLALDPRVLIAADLDLEAEVSPRLTDQRRQLLDRELLGELVEDPELARRRGVLHRQLDAAQGVADVEEAPGLAAATVDGQRVTDHRLQAEAVEHGAEDLVVVEASQQALVAGRLLGLDPVDDALVEVGGPQAPDAAGKMDIGRVVDLGAVIERSGLLREGQGVAAPLVLDLDEAFLDVDVRGAVLPHRSELHQVAVGYVVADREQQVEGPDHIRVLGLDRPLARHHRVGRGGLLPVVDHRFRAGLGDHLVEEGTVLDPAGVAADLLAGDLPPSGDPLVEAADRGERVRLVLLVPAAPGEVVEDGDLVASGREPQGRRPAEIAVAPENENAHGAGG